MICGCRSRSGCHAALAAAPAASSNLLAQTSGPAAVALAGATPLRLAAAYYLRLQSTWPALPAAGDACADPGSESLEGTLVRMDGTRYEGRFVRRTTLAFCGPHGAAAREQCGGALAGEGVVRVVAEVAEERPARSVMSVVWWPLADSTRVTVRGNCPAGFAAALEGMYRSTPHALEFGLPAPGGSRRLALEDYGWVLEIE